MTASACEIVGERCPELEQLNLRGVPVTDEAIGTLAMGAPDIHTLHLSTNNPFGGSLISDAGACAIQSIESKGVKGGKHTATNAPLLFTN